MWGEFEICPGKLLLNIHVQTQFIHEFYRGKFGSADLHEDQFPGTNVQGIYVQETCPSSITPDIVHEICQKFFSPGNIPKSL